MPLDPAAPVTAYADLPDFRRAIAAPIVWTSKSSETENEEFTGSKSFADAEKLLLNGYPKGREMLLRDLAAASKVAHLTLATLDYSVAGGRIDIARYCSGAPDFYIVEGEEQQAPARIARFDISLSTSCGVTTKTMSARAAGVLSWVDALESIGTRCEIVLSCGQHCNGVLFGFRLTLKRAEEPLDVDRIAYAMLHPSFFRRHVFRWMETQIPASHQCYGYGNPAGLKPEGIDGEIYFKALHGNDPDFKNAETAAASVKRMIEAAGFLEDIGQAA